MKPGRSSKTAEHNALFRALESRRPESERLVDDPMAVAFLSPPYRAIVRLARLRPWRDAVIRLIDRRWPGVRPTVVARTRLIDETIAGVVGAAVARQVVVLGAGFDTRAWRLGCLDGLAVFEVDHPDTQRTKRAVLRRLGAERSDVRLVPTDFHLGRLATAMAQAGFDSSTPTLFLWEGTTNYLSAEAVDATLRWCARAPAGSHLLFTYIDRDVLVDPRRYVGAEQVFSTLRRAGERMTFGIAPHELAEFLAERGLRLVADTGAPEFRAQVYGAAARTIRGHEFYRVAHACIEPGDKVRTSASGRARRED